MSIIQDWLLEKETRSVKQLFATDPFYRFDCRKKPNRQLKKEVGLAKAIELITEHGYCLVKKDKNTYWFLDGYIFTTKENLTIGQTDKLYDYKRRLNRKLFLINLTLVIATVIFVINMWILLYGDYVYEYLINMK